jgi:hypothetical protein
VGLAPLLLVLLAVLLALQKKGGKPRRDERLQSSDLRADISCTVNPDKAGIIVMVLR